MRRWRRRSCGWLNGATGDVAKRAQGRREVRVPRGEQGPTTTSRACDRDADRTRAGKRTVMLDPAPTATSISATSRCPRRQLRFGCATLQTRSRERSRARRRRRRAGHRDRRAGNRNRSRSPDARTNLGGRAEHEVRRPVPEPLPELLRVVLRPAADPDRDPSKEGTPASSVRARIVQSPKRVTESVSGNPISVAAERRNHRVRSSAPRRGNHLHRPRGRSSCRSPPSSLTSRS
jgi:hypothetical protein